MINEGNSLAELQARVLRASPHEKKSETLSWAQFRDLIPYPMDIVWRIPAQTMASIRQTAHVKAIADKMDALIYATLMNSASPTSSAQAVSLTVTSAGISQQVVNLYDVV